MTDNFEKKVAVDGPVVNAGELGSSTFSPGQALPAGPLGLGQRWTVARKREVVLRLLRDEPVQLLSRQLGVEIFRLEQWREKAIGGIDASLKQRKGDPVQAELDSAMRPEHPMLHTILDRTQSASSLRLLLRNPLGFVWRYGLGWHGGCPGLC